VSSHEKILSKASSRTTKTNDLYKLNDNFKTFLIRFYETYVLLVESNEYEREFSEHLNMNKLIMSSLSNENEKKEIMLDWFKIDLNNLVKESPDQKLIQVDIEMCECNMACYLQDYSHDQLCSNKYSKSCADIYGNFSMHSSGQEIDSEFNFDKEFCSNYTEIKRMHLENVRLVIDDEELSKQMTKLEWIFLSNNDLEAIPSSFYTLNKLEILDIENNKLNNFHRERDLFKNMKSLKTLEIKNIKCDQNREANVVELPESIENFSLKDFSSSSLPFRLTSKLDTVVLRGFPWIDLDNYGGNNAMVSLENLLTELNENTKIFSEQEIRKLVNKLDENGNGFLEKDEIVKLNAFIFKKFSRIENEIPNDIFQLENLTSLDLSYQAIRSIPDQIESLKNLSTLKLSNCVLLENLSAKCGLLPLKELDLTNCLSLKTPPPEIVKRGFNSLMAYLKRLSSGSVLCKKTKLMLVGLGIPTLT
jgi:Leucine-rich repeat (LRR) protein